MADKLSEYTSALILSRAHPPKLNEAFELLTAASNKGDDRATYALATWYLFGNEVVDKDEERGVCMLIALHDSLVAEALFDLAVSYDLGRYVQQDDHKAFSFYMKAALLGDSDSCRQVSQFYAEGTVVGHDEALSKAWQMRSECDEREISPPYRLWIDI
jgi:TPR repeat protein